MSLVTVFRILLVAFVALYLSAMNAPIVSPTSPPEVLQYEKWLGEQPVSGSAVWGFLILLGHVLDLVGLVLLFLRRKIGIYFLLAGFVACLGPGSELPYLQGALSGNLMAFTNIAWGAIVALAFSAPKALFVVKAEKEA